MYSDNLTNEFYKKGACACGTSPPAEVSLIPIKIGISRVPFFFFFFQGVSLFVTPFSPLLLPLTSFLFLPSNYRLSITSVVEPATSHSPVDFLVFVTLQLGESQVGVIKLLYATGGETDLSTLRFKSSARADRQQRIISGADVYSAFSSLRQKKSEADRGLGVTFVFWCFIEKKKKKRYLYSTYQNIVSEIRDTDYTHKTLWYPHVRKKKKTKHENPLLGYRAIHLQSYSSPADGGCLRGKSTKQKSRAPACRRSWYIYSELEGYIKGRVTTFLHLKGTLEHPVSHFIYRSG